MGDGRWAGVHGGCGHAAAAAVVTLVCGDGRRREWPKRRRWGAVIDGRWAGGHTSCGQAVPAEVWRWWAMAAAAEVGRWTSDGR